VQAWAFLDPVHALAQARAADELKMSGGPIGPLHGVPVGLKDIIDTADMPTENGSVLHAGRTPSRDAAVVAMLRAAGAVIMGKTVTTIRHRASKTKPSRSVARRAARQRVRGRSPPAWCRSPSDRPTDLIRPAAFCGVYGFKPTHGLIPRHGVFQLSRTLDHVGLFARTSDDIALLAEQLVGYDERDPDTRPRARIPYREMAAEEPPLSPMFAFVKTSRWDRVTDETREAFAELTGHLGDRVEEVELVAASEEAFAWHRLVMEAEMALSLEREWEHGREHLSASLRAQLERGRSHTALEYQRVLRRLPPAVESLADLFAQRYDAIITPAAPGTAPAGLEATGDPSFCTLWTLFGMPALTVPLMQGAEGLPLGVQLVGPRHGDARLLRTARWLSRALDG
jgi:Asp-tRNA(Asn)/Glu-tRNA(Gln) amidotransferase A subunit family amidase